ncbi:tryptophan 7-halogenase, partial [Acinetobacter baumannii]
DISYGYHFDAHLVGAVLRDHAVRQGVRHLATKVVEVAMGDTATVDALVTESGDHINADIFVDCSGFRGVIAQEALGERFLPFAAN